MEGNDRSVTLDLSSHKHPHLASHVLSDNQPALSAATLLVSLIENTNSNCLYQITFLTTVRLEETLKLKLIETRDLLSLVIDNVAGNTGDNLAGNGIVISAKVSKMTEKLELLRQELMCSASFPLHSDDIDLVLSEKFYQFMYGVGYRHKDEFRSIHWLELRVCGDKAYGTVILTPSTHLDCQVDGVWQAMVYALLSTRESTDLLVPFCIRSLSFSKLPRESRLNVCSGRFIVNLRENYGNFILFDGQSNEILMTGEETIFLPRSSNEIVKRKNDGVKQENKEAREDVVSEAKKSNRSQKEIGIRSMACRLPGNVKSPLDFWELLKLTCSTDQRIPASRIPNRNELIRGQRYGNPIEGGNFLDEDVALFDTNLFGLSHNEAKAADPQQRLALTCAYECLEKAGLITDDRERVKTLPVFVAMMGTGEYADNFDANDALIMLGSSASVMCGRISHFLDSRGTSIVVDTACSSSLVALDMACGQLLEGRIDRALVIGINLILSENAMGQRANGKLLSIDGRCKSFDQTADGYGRADGCVAILIERAEEGRQYEAMIESTNTNHDGRSAALTVPNGASHIELIQECVGKVKTLEEEKKIAFWECHGTGTALGDPIELNALQKALSMYEHSLDETVYLSTAKATIGHTEAASGLVGVMKAVLQMQYRSIFPLPNFQTLNPRIQLLERFEIPTKLVHLHPIVRMCCGVSSFGVGGTNACAVLSSANSIHFCPQFKPTFGLLPVSAKTKQSLQLTTERMSSIKFNEFLAPASALYRRHYPHRAVFIRRQNTEFSLFKGSNAKLEICETTAKNELLKQLPQLRGSLDENSDIIAILKFLKEAGIDRRMFEETAACSEILDVVYSHNQAKSDVLDRQRGLFLKYQNKRSPVNSIETLEEVIACAYLTNLYDINWPFIYPSIDENFLLETVKKLPTYSFDNTVCWRVNRDCLTFDHRVFGNLIEKNGENLFKFEGYLSDNRLKDLFDQDTFTVGVVVEGLSEILNYLSPTNSSIQIQKWQFNDRVCVSQMWVFTEVELRGSTWQFHFLTDQQTICKATGSFNHIDENVCAKDFISVDSTVDPPPLKKPKTLISSNNHDGSLRTTTEKESFYAAEAALILNKIINDAHVKPTEIRGRLRSLSHYTSDGSEIKIYNAQDQLCIQFSEATEDSAEQSKNVNETRHCSPHQLIDDKKTDELPRKIAKILQLSVASASGLELNEEYYDVGFFDLGIDSLSMIGFANQLMEAQLPRLTSVEIMDNPTSKQDARSESRRIEFRPYSLISVVNKLAFYIRQKTLSINEQKQQQCGSGYSSMLNEGEHKLSAEQRVTTDTSQLIYQVLKNPDTERCQFRLLFVLKTSGIFIFHRFAQKRFELTTFNSLLKRLVDTRPSKIELSFKMQNEETDFNSTAMSTLFIRLGNTLISINQPIELHVRDTKNLICGMAMSFLKSLCAEHPSVLRFCFHERLRLIGKTAEERSRRLMSKCWIITGGTSGIGWQMAKHLLQKYPSVASVVLIARRQPLDGVLQEINVYGGRIQIMLADVSSRHEVLEVFKKISKEHKSVSVIHSAGVADDALLQAQDVERFGRVFDAKCKGLLNLVTAVERYSIRIDNWILNSSVSAVLGNVGQTNYAASNSFLDSFSQLHRNVCSINWGNWVEFGFAASTAIIETLRQKGLHGLTTEEALDCFDWVLQHPEQKQILVTRADWPHIFKFRPDLQNVVYLSDTKPKQRLHSPIRSDLSYSLQQEDIVDVPQIEQMLETEVKKLLKFDPEESVDKTTGFMQLGLDSLGMFNLSNEINGFYGQNLINIIHLFEHSTIKTLSVFLLERLTEYKKSTGPIQHSNGQGSSKPTQNGQQQEKKEGGDEKKDEREEDVQMPSKSGSTGTIKSTVHFLKPLKRPNLIFLFAGHGSLYPNVCVDLCMKVPRVKQQVELCSQHFHEYLKISVAELIIHGRTDEIKSLPVEHAVIFTIGYSLAKFWIHIGLEPTHLIGHSLGEIVALCIAGYLEPKAASHLVYMRATALEKCRGKGAMMAVDSQFKSELRRFDLSVAAINGPRQIVVSGATKQIEKARMAAIKHGLSTKLISDEYAFHSKLVKDKYLRHLRNFNWSEIHQPSQNEMKVISNLNGEPLNTEFNYHYVKLQMTSTVQFWKSIENLLKEGEFTVLEVGPGRILSSLTQKILNERALRYLVLNTIQKDQSNELDTLKWSAQKLELKGFSIYQREFSRAIGEDFVEQVSNAFNSSFRLAKTGSLNAKHHRVTYQRRLPSLNTERQSNFEDPDQQRQSDDSKQLVLHKRQIEVEGLDLEIVSDHRLFGETVVPAAFHLKCFIDHLHLQHTHLNDVRLTNKILIEDLAGLTTVFNQRRLQLRRSGDDKKLFSSCLVQVPEATSSIRRLSVDLAENMQSPSVPAELDLCVRQEKKKSPVEQSDEVPDFPDYDPGIWISSEKFYEGMAASGLRYGKHLRLLLDIRLIGLNMIRTICKKPSAGWVLFDLALQTLSAGLFDARSAKCYVPIGIDEVYSNFPTDWTSNDQGPWTFHGEVIRRDGDIVEGNVWIFTRGVMIGYLKGIRAVRVLAAASHHVSKKKEEVPGVISTDNDSYDNPDGTNNKKKKRSHQWSKELSGTTTSETQTHTKHVSKSGVTSEASRRRSSSTASKIARALSTLKKARRQNFPLRFRSRFKMKEADDLLLVIRGSFGQFATDEPHPLFKSISQQSYSPNVFMLQQSKTEIDAAFFNLTPREATYMDPNQRFLLEATQRCLESSGLKRLPSDCGIFIGSSSSEFAQKAFAELEDPNPYLVSGTNSSALSGRLAHFFQTNGPCLTIDTACSSFHAALGVACEFLNHQSCSWALVGASNLILNDKTTKADGFVRSEGYGVILIEAIPKTKAYMLRNDSVIIKGWSVGHTGGRSAGFLVPDSYSQSTTMIEACQQGPIDLIECHGTGTSLGDPIEIEAVKRFLKTVDQSNKYVYLNSTKTYFGHCEAAAGLVSTLSMLEVMKNNRLPPLRHFSKLNPNIKLLDTMRLPTETVEEDFRRILVNSFGITGTNSSILLEKYTPIDDNKFNFNRASATPLSTPKFNRQHLWPFDSEVASTECKIYSYQLEFEDIAITLNQLAEQAKTIIYCGSKFTKQSISIGRLKPATIRELSGENLILLWRPQTEKKLIEQSAKVCKLMAILKSDSYIDVVASISYMPTILALIKTCIAERTFKNLRCFALDTDLNLKLPRLRVESFVSKKEKVSVFNKCLVTGGLGGLGIKLLKQLPANRKLAIGRTTRTELPLNCKYWACDVAERTQLERIFRTEPHIDLVVHCAGIVQNSLLKNQDLKSLEQVSSPKIAGTKNLLRLCREYKVKKLVVISSVAAIYGSLGQANYAIANAEMNRLVAAEDKIECLSIALGPIGDVGMLSSVEKQPVRQQIEANGWTMMCADEVIKQILSILSERGQFMIASGSNLLLSNEKCVAIEKDVFQDSFREKSKRRRRDLYDVNTIEKSIETLLYEISGLTKVPPNRGFMSLGIDSLMIEHLRSRLSQRFEIDVRPAEMYEHTSLAQLTEFLKIKLGDKAESMAGSISTTSVSTVAETSKIAIVGFACEMPNSDNIDHFFQQLIEGKELFKRTAEERPNCVNVSSCLKDVDLFDPGFFDLSDEDAALLDPQIKVLLKVAHNAFEIAGYTRERRRQLKIACFTSAEPSEYDVPKLFAQGSLQGMYAHNQKDFIAAWTSHLLDLNGPSNAVYSACSSSLVAMANAVQLLQTSSDIDMCLVGGINLVREIGHQIEKGSPMSKEDHCRPFSKRAGGIIRGSACGVVLLKRLKDAVQNNDFILASIKSISTNNDANRHKSNFLAPSIQGQQEVIEECLRTIEEGSTLDYIECHSTGTLVGDAIEIKALQNALLSTKVKSKPIVGSLKANIGHSFAASGMASLSKCLKILETHNVPPQINVEENEVIEEVDPNLIDINIGSTIKLPHDGPLRLMINNFGIGGTNACMILEEEEEEVKQNKKGFEVYKDRQVEEYHPIVISAKSKKACIEYCHRLADHLIEHPDMGIISNTLLNYRDQHDYRFFALARNGQEAANLLQNVEEFEVKKARPNRHFALYFAHQGVQYPEMLEVDRRVCGEFNKLYGKFVCSNNQDDINDPSVASALLFGVFAAILEFLKKLGGLPQPELVFGHSLGEYGAFLASGALEFKRGLDFLTERGKLFHKTEKAKMFAIQIDKDEVHEHLHLSAVLSPTLRSFVCLDRFAEEVKQALNKKGLQWKELRSDYGFHSSFIDPILPEFLCLTDKLRFADNNIPVISNMDGKLITKITPEYLALHLRQPVRMDLTLETLKRDFPSVDTVIEMGPSGILGSLLDTTILNHIPTVQSFTQHRHYAVPSLLQSIGALWQLGFPVDLSTLFGSTNAIERRLPTYAFEERVFKWPDKSVPQAFKLYQQVWRLCLQLTPEERRTNKKIRLFTDSTTTFTPSVSNFIEVFEINSDALNNLEDDSPEVILHFCAKPDYNNTFHFLHSFQRVKFSRDVVLISCGLFDEPLSSLSIGPLEELQHSNSNLRTIHILFEDLISLESCLVNNLNQVTTLDTSKISRFRCINNTLLQVDYTSCTSPLSKRSIKEGSVCLLIGGSGSLGSSLIEYLQPSSRLIALSRRNPRKAYTNVQYYKADVTNRQELSTQLTDVKKKYPGIDYTFFIAGLRPSSRKSKDEMEEVMQCKVDGLRNLIEVANSIKISLGSLVLCSSLSAVNGMPNVEEYCSANCFLDHQSALTTTESGNIVSIQLPPLRSSQMLKSEGESILEENSISLSDAVKYMIEISDSKNGIYALSKVNPLQIRQFFKELKSSTIRENANGLKPAEVLFQIWRSLLPRSAAAAKKTKKGMDENEDFFSLGGNSLSALQLIWKIQEEFDVKLEMDKLIENSKFNQMLHLIENATKAPSRIKRVNKQKGRLSMAQEQMWILLKSSKPATYNVVFKLEIKGDFDENRALEALKLLVERQKILRSRFREEDGEVFQEVVPTDEALKLSFMSLVDQPQKSVEDLIRRELSYDFDLSQTAFRFILAKHEGNFVVIVNQQHIITDGWSINVFAEEFSFFYRNQQELPPLKIDYLDYAEHSRRSFDELKCKEYANYLKKLPRQGTILWPSSPSSCNQLETFLSPQTVEELDALCDEFLCTRFLLLISAFIKCLDRWRWRAVDEYEPIVVGCPSAGRNEADVSRLQGYFLNNMVVSVETRENLQTMTLPDLLELVRNSVNQAHKYADVPFHRAVAQLSQARNTANHQPVFQIFFNYRHQLDFPVINLGPGLDCTVTQLTNNNTFQLSCTIDELNEKDMRITLDYDPESLKHQIVSGFIEDLKRSIQNLRNTDRLDYEFVHKLEDDSEHIGPFRSVIEMIYEQCSLRPDSIALQTPNGGQISYGELRTRMEKNARILNNKFEEMGRPPSSIVPALLNMNLTVEWALAVLACGLAYCPMDPNQPLMRTQMMIKKLGSSFVVSDVELEGLNVLNVRNTSKFENEVDPPPHRVASIQPNHLAYSIFTSGSTGEPKAVCIEHAQLFHFVQRSRYQFSVNSDSRIAHSVNTVFDVSIFNIFATLTSGGCLIQKEEILDFITTNTVPLSHLILSSAIFNSLRREHLESLSKRTRWIVVGGETPSDEALRIVSAKSDLQISQFYGPTETTVWCSVKHYKSDECLDGKNIGRACQPFFLTTINGTPLELGSKAVGELWICGDQVGRGYLNCNDGGGFVEGFFGNVKKAYRTGDLVRVIDGQLEFLGRRDHQFKINGMRIDPGEISRVIEEVGKLKQACVTLINDKLIAFVIGRIEVEEGALKSELMKHLPRYMTPERIIQLEGGFPLNNSGKIDMHKLKESYSTKEEVPEDVSPLTKKGQKLAEIWMQTVGPVPINLKTNFFEIGGHSLSILTLQSKIREELSVELSFDQIYRFSDFDDQLSLIEEHINSDQNDVIQPIRESRASEASVYCLHPIGGTIYSYYSMATFWPTSCNVYAIAYSKDYPAETLEQLVEFYHEQIIKHARGRPFLLLGHSLGGILAWEVARICLKNNQPIPIVCAFDSWVVDNDKLDEQEVLKYLQNRFSGLENSRLIESSLNLCKMLKNHHMKPGAVPLHLFKAERLGETALKHVIRKDLTEEMVRNKVDNGWMDFVDDLSVHPCSSDHDSIMDFSVLNQYLWLFEKLIEQARSGPAFIHNY